MTTRSSAAVPEADETDVGFSRGYMVIVAVVLLLAAAICVELLRTAHASLSATSLGACGGVFALVTMAYARHVMWSHDQIDQARLAQRAHVAAMLERAEAERRVADALREALSSQVEVEVRRLMGFQTFESGVTLADPVGHTEGEHPDRTDRFVTVLFDSLPVVEALNDDDLPSDDVNDEVESGREPQRAG
jgi:hypothetical protein